MEYRSTSRAELGLGGGIGQASTPSGTMECPFCAEQINARARKCRFCGETLDVALRKAEEAARLAERQGGNVYMNAAVAASAPAPAQRWERKSRGAAILLALFLGGLGVHKFYLGRVGWGIVYLLLCWTFVPAVIAFVEAVVYLFSSDAAFQRKYAVPILSY